MRNVILAATAIFMMLLSAGPAADADGPPTGGQTGDPPAASGKASREADSEATVEVDAPRIVQVTVSAGGMGEDEAIRQAKRKAVEQVAGTHVVSTTEVRDYVLIRDTILTRSNGFVERFEVLRRREEPDGVCVVTARATVSVGGLRDAWGVVRGLLAEMGRPKIMVCVRERVDDDVREASTVQARVEKLLLESGFDLVDRTQLEAIERKEIDAALRQGKKDQLGAIARRFGAQLFITGAASTRFERAREVYRIPLQFYGGSANLRCFATDSAKLLSSRSAAASGTDRLAARSATKSLHALAETIAPRIRADILRHWQDVLEGSCEVTLIVCPIRFDALSDLEGKLAAIEGVGDVASTFDAPTARLTIQADVRGPDLAKRIAKSLGDRLEITGVQPNVIEARTSKVDDRPRAPAPGGGAPAGR